MEGTDSFCGCTVSRPRHTLTLVTSFMRKEECIIVIFALENTENLHSPQFDWSALGSGSDSAARGQKSKWSQDLRTLASPFTERSICLQTAPCCLENPRDGGAWWAAICGVVQSWTQLKRLSSSSSSSFYQMTQWTGNICAFWFFNTDGKWQERFCQTRTWWKFWSVLWNQMLCSSLKFSGLFNADVYRYWASFYWLLSFKSSNWSVFLKEGLRIKKRAGSVVMTSLPRYGLSHRVCYKKSCS